MLLAVAAVHCILMGIKAPYMRKGYENFKKLPDYWQAWKPELAHPKVPIDKMLNYDRFGVSEKMMHQLEPLLLSKCFMLLYLLIQHRTFKFTATDK